MHRLGNVRCTNAAVLEGATDAVGCRTARPVLDVVGGEGGTLTEQVAAGVVNDLLVALVVPAQVLLLRLRVRGNRSNTGQRRSPAPRWRRRRPEASTWPAEHGRPSDATTAATPASGAGERFEGGPRAVPGAQRERARRVRHRIAVAEAVAQAGSRTLAPPLDIAGAVTLAPGVTGGPTLSPPSARGPRRRGRRTKRRNDRHRR